MLTDEAAEITTVALVLTVPMDGDDRLEEDEEDKEDRGVEAADRLALPRDGAAAEDGGDDDVAKEGADVPEESWVVAAVAAALVERVVSVDEASWDADAAELPARPDDWAAEVAGADNKGVDDALDDAAAVVDADVREVPDELRLPALVLAVVAVDVPIGIPVDAANVEAIRDAELLRLLEPCGVADENATLLLETLLGKFADTLGLLADWSVVKEDGAAELPIGVDLTFAEDDDPGGATEIEAEEDDMAALEGPDAAWQVERADGAIEPCDEVGAVLSVAPDDTAADTDDAAAEEGATLDTLLGTMMLAELVEAVEEEEGNPANVALLLYMLSLSLPPQISVLLPEQGILQPIPPGAGPPPLSVVLPQTTCVG
jgi:hypothetical protein